MDSAKGGLAKVSAVLCGTACSIIWIGIMFAIPTTSLVFGVLYREQCPLEPYIPLYQLVFGAAGVLQGVLRLVSWATTCCCGRNSSDDDDNSPPCAKCLKVLESLTGFFLCCWFFAGCYWVYSVYGSVEYVDTESAAYCHATLYLYSFWLLNVTFILIGLIVPLACCIMCCFCCCACCAIKGAEAGGSSSYNMMASETV